MRIPSQFIPRPPQVFADDAARDRYTHQLYDAVVKAIEALITANNGPGVSIVPAFHAHKDGTDQTGVAVSTPTKVTFGTEDFDAQNYFASDRFTPTMPGKYFINASVSLEGGAASKFCSIYLYKNGSLMKANRGVTADATNGVNATLSAIVEANGTTDYFEIYVEQDIKANNVISGLATATYFDGAWIAP